MNSAYRFHLADAPAVLHIASGEIVTVQFPDSDGLGPDAPRCRAVGLWSARR